MHKENDVSHGNKVTSASIRVDVTPNKSTTMPKRKTERQYDVANQLYPLTDFGILAKEQSS